MNKKTKLVISGLDGKRELSGEVSIAGSKNFVLPAMASALLFENELVLENVPELEDVSAMAEILKKIGVKIERQNDKMTLKSGNNLSSEIDFEIGKKMRASIILLGPLLGRTGKTTMPHPGGCAIGRRPIDLFVQNFSKMGTKISLENEKYEFSTSGLKNEKIIFKNQSVTATTAFVLAGILSKGKMIIENSALEPEITELLKFLTNSGAEISGIGTATLEIIGREGKLLSAKSPLKIIPDRIEAGSFAVVGALSAKELTIKNCEPSHLSVFLECLSESGVKMEIGDKEIKILKSENLSAINIRTHEYPGFPTDLQSPFTVLLTQAEGESLVFETIFENRLKYTEDLVKMGAGINMFDTHHAIIKGKTPLEGKNLESPDLRAGLAFIIAGIVANGQSEIGNAGLIDRGYEKIEEKLKKIGLKIERVSIN